MAKLNIDGVFVYTDDFNEEQMKAYREAVSIAEEISRLELLIHCLKSRQAQIAPLLLPEEVAEDLAEDLSEDLAEGLSEQLGMFEPEDLEPDETETSA